jgi:hypothetical protein
MRRQIAGGVCLIGIHMVEPFREIADGRRNASLTGYTQKHRNKSI